MLIATRAAWCVGLVLLAANALSAAGIPKHLSHQGVLTDTGGVVVPDGAYTLAFDIYDAASSGNPLFGQELQVEVVDGVYNVLLSDNPGSPGTLEQAFQNPTTYLEITIAGVPPGSGITPGQTLAPRQKLASVPYAFVAQSTEPSARVLVDEHEANDDAEVVLSLPTEFDRFEVDVTDVVPVSVSPVDLWVQVSRDGGSTWDTGSSDYAWQTARSHRTGVDTEGVDDDGKIVLTYSVDSGLFANVGRIAAVAGRSYNARIDIQNPGGGWGYFSLLADASYIGATSGRASNVTTTGHRRDASRVDALRFIASSGNILSGKFKVYGLR